jgi:rhamnose transport system substrate-binding protein
MRTPNIRRKATVAAALALVGTTMAACGSSDNKSANPTSSPTSTGVKKGMTVYFIPKDTQNPYEVLADNGGKKALTELGGKVVVSSGTADTAAAQIPSIQAAIQAHADAIVIAGNDPSALCPSLNQAAKAGVKIVSFDSDINCGSSPSHLFINQADTKTIGTSEVDLLAKQINSTGEIAILSAAASATNQNAWIGYMKQQLPKYPKMKLVSTVYGNDDPATSLTVLHGLLSAYPNLKGIISPTTVGISTAAQYLSTHKDVAKRVTLTGLGLPSQMRSYIKDGTRAVLRAVEPLQPRLPRRLRGGLARLGQRQLANRIEVQGRHVGRVHGARPHTGHRPVGGARAADGVRQVQH